MFTVLNLHRHVKSAEKHLLFRSLPAVHTCLTGPVVHASRYVVCIHYTDVFNTVQHCQQDWRLLG